MADDTASMLNRVFLWIVPRTISTALEKCLSFVDGIQIIHQPYECAFHSGPDRRRLDLANPILKTLAEVYDYTKSTEPVPGYDESICSYKWVREELLGAPYQDKKILFCKEYVLYLDGRYDMLPMGFRYSFAIRHPAKVFPSLKKSILKTFGQSFAEVDDLRKAPAEIFPKGYGYKELYELVEYVEKNFDQESVIIDTDDLLADPTGILSAYCHQMGIPYSPDLLFWEAGDAVTKSWKVARTLLYANRTGGFFDKALQSSGFRQPTPVPSLESLPADVQACVEASMGYYEKLHDRRIKALHRTISSEQFLG